jgi:arabinose-5-phosphate isomerase
MTKPNYIRIAKQVAKIEALELKKINRLLNSSFIKTVNLIGNCKGKIICAGVGKSGIIARKISATLSSVGVSSFFLNPSEANHGDLGQIDKRDMLLIFSYSGNTSEILNMLKYANRFNIKIVGVSSKVDSLLLKASDIKILLPKVKEADPDNLVPTSSTSLQLLLGDCLAICLMNKMKFTKERFKIYHPGGNIGQTLLLVKDIMIRERNKIPLINFNSNIITAVKTISKKNLGIGIIIKNKSVIGIVTDGDIRRGTKNYSERTKIAALMSKKPLYVGENTSAAKALSIMNEKKITSLIVSSDSDYKKHKVFFRPKGILHIHSLLKYGIK